MGTKRAKRTEIICYSPGDDDIWRFDIRDTGGLCLLHAETRGRYLDLIVTSVDYILSILEANKIIVLQEQEY